MKVLITGGTGYIGSHTCIELIKSGYEPIIVDNLYNSKIETLDKIKEITGVKPKFYKGDIRDKEQLRQIFKENEIDSVVHFAGLKAVPESVKKPLMYYEWNVGATVNLLNVMKEFKCRKIVFSSSATVYGEPATVPVKEDFPLSATNPYGSTKLIIENILKDTQKADDNLIVTILRYFNPIGAHESGLIGEEPNGIPNNLMPRIIKVAKGEEDAITVCGKDYPTPDGTGVRDYIHVVDLAIGHIKALQNMNTPGVYIYNLGTGIGYSVLDIINTFNRVNNIKIKTVDMPRRPGDIPVNYADPSKALIELNWKAELGIEEMCKSAWDFAKNN